MFTLTSFSSVVEFLLALFKQQTSECLQMKIIIHVHTLTHFNPLFFLYGYFFTMGSSPVLKTQRALHTFLITLQWGNICLSCVCLWSITSSCLGKDNSKPCFCTIDNLHQLDCCPYESSGSINYFSWSRFQMMDAKGAVWCGIWQVLKHLQWKELEKLVNFKDAFVACSRCSNREAVQRDVIRKNSKGVG